MLILLLLSYCEVFLTSSIFIILYCMFVCSTTYYLIIISLEFNMWNDFFNSIKYVRKTIWSSEFSWFIFNYDKMTYYNSLLSSSRSEDIMWQWNYHWLMCAGNCNWDYVMLLNSNNWFAAVINVCYSENKNSFLRRAPFICTFSYIFTQF